MGQKHREERKKLKAQTASLEKQGWYENEFGELKKRTTKADARKWLLRLRTTLDDMLSASMLEADRLMQSLHNEMQNDCLKLLSQNICKEIDNQVLMEL